MVLTDDVTRDEGEDLIPGDTVIVVDVHPDGEAYVVEFLTLDDVMDAIGTLLPPQARAVTSKHINHGRPVETPA